MKPKVEGFTLKPDKELKILMIKEKYEYFGCVILGHWLFDVRSSESYLIFEDFFVTRLERLSVVIALQKLLKKEATILDFKINELALKYPQMFFNI